ncbi:MAG TPA: VOC family protein [Candidatus Limnocylindria bacterium]|nr:VOC family protein [Candidatus Limnocylindria bacterium]
MIRGIDHLVIAVPDPDAAADELETTLGLAATGGGRHAGSGTFNRIAWLADGAYLELIGVDDRALAERGPIGAAVLRTLDTVGAGLAAYALAVDDLELTVAELRANRSPISEPMPGSRTRPDGDLVAWSIAVPPRLGLDGLPFLIHHLPTGAEWEPAAVAARRTQRHPIGSPVWLARLDIAAAEPAARAADHAAQLGIEFWAVADLAVVELGPHVIRLRPPREMSHPAVLTLDAEVEVPRTADLFGMRFDVARVELPLPAAR